MVPTTKAVLKSVDMTDELMQETVECAGQVDLAKSHQSYEVFNTRELRIAQRIHLHF